MILALLLPFFIQMSVIGIDEFCFHVKRGLPKWECIGHPLDTLTVLFCFGFLLLFPYSPFHLKIYCGLAVFSSLFVTKDEFIHKECCAASEQWLHALLFLNHPVVLSAAGLLWPLIDGVSLFAWMDPLLSYKAFFRQFLIVQTLFTALFFSYQVLYWNFLRKPHVAD